MANKERITHDRVLKLFLYSDGLLLWRVKKGRCGIAGSVAGSIGARGHWRIGVDGKDYLRSHLVWFYKTASWPKEQIDHIDVNPLNDRIENLREATNIQNSANKRKYCTNTSGFKGVYYFKTTRRWMAQIKANGKLIYLGYYDTPEQAHVAYSEAALKHNGVFARTA